MKLITYDPLYIEQLVRKRPLEVKLGERVRTLPWNTVSNLAEVLKNDPCRFVLLGLPEDIGVRANGGRGGAYSAWNPVLNTFLNTQSNDYLKGEEILVLGHVDFSDELLAVKDYDFHNEEHLSGARAIVSAIDDYVAPVIASVIGAGKELIVIGGGHNNAYPNIKGAVEGLRSSGKKIDRLHVINCDAHTDFRPLEGRHSGNAFSYAFAHGYLGNYSIIGVHESYNTGAVLKELRKHNNIIFSTFEEIFVREELTFRDAVHRAISFSSGPSGLELDLDIIQNIPSSAKTSSGISTVEARQLVHNIASHCECVYFHVAEAAPVLSHIKTDLKTGKLVTYLICDYIKARLKRDEVK